jgi:adenylylsulfate kinase
LIQRDVKGLYAKALRGEIAQFTGISDPYEPPLNPDVHLRTDQMTLRECLDQLLVALERLDITVRRN